VSVVLIDELNTSFEDQAYARAQLVGFLQQVQPQDRLALYALGRRLLVLHEFTSDSGRLLAVLARYAGHPSTEFESSSPPKANELPPNHGGSRLGPGEQRDGQMDRFFRQAFAGVTGFSMQQRVQFTLDALEAIANHLVRLPGRKNLIWLSGSFPCWIGMDCPTCPFSAAAERRTFFDEIERATRAINNANLAIYPVDARGLVADVGIGAQNSVPRINSPRNVNPRNLSVNRRLEELLDTQATMSELAGRTGGRAFYNTNDIRGAVRSAFDDSRLTYLLGYYPTHGEWDGTFREIKVQVKRPGVQVRYRRGYFAMPEERLTDEQRRAALVEAAWSPLEATALGLTVQVKPVESIGKKRLKLLLNVDPHEVTLDQQADRWVGSLDVLVVEEDKAGNQLSAVKKTIDMRLTSTTHGSLLRKGLNFGMTEAVESSAIQLRAVVRDNPSGALGSVTIPLAQ
jgi:VWFA-related protein